MFRGGVHAAAGHYSDARAGRAVRTDQRRIDYLHRCEPADHHPWERYTCSAAAHCCCRGMAGATGYEGIGGFPAGLHRFCQSRCAGSARPPDLLSRQRDLFLVADAPDPRRTQCLPDWAELPRVALYSAIPVNRTLYALYAMTGFASAVAAVLLVSYFGSARSDLGASFLMPAITAVVLRRR